MNRKQWIALITAVIVLAGWMYYRQTDQALIRRELKSAARQLEKHAPEGTVTAAARAHAAASVFITAPIIEWPGIPAQPASRADVQSMLYLARARIEHISIALHDIQLTLDADRRNAAMELTAHIRAGKTGHEEWWTQPFSIDWEKTPDGWRIRHIASIEAVRWPGGTP